MSLDVARSTPRSRGSAVSGEVSAAPRNFVRPAASLVIVPCSSRKSVVPATGARAVSLPVTQQSVLETAWLRLISALPANVEAGDLYRGRGYTMAARAAERAGCGLMIVSAGLGLVNSARDVPAYGLTLAGTGGPDGILGRVVGRFEPASWWRAVQSGAFATSFVDAFPDDGLVLLGLSQPYARLVADELATLDDARLDRLRIVGATLAQLLPDRVVRASLLPYDERLDRLVPGVRADYAHRALTHFLDLLGDPRSAPAPGDRAEGHRALVLEALGKVPHTRPPTRQRVTDQDIADLIAARLAAGSRRAGAALLRVLRHEDGIACEAARFSRIYRRVAEEAVR